MRSVLQSVAITSLGLVAACGAPATPSSPISVPTDPSASESGGAVSGPASNLPAGRTVSAEATISIPLALELGSGENRIWMLTRDSVTGIDPKTNEVAAVIPLTFEFGGMVEAAGSLWFPDFDGDVLHRYDLESGAWLSDVAVMHHPNRIGVHDGSLWVANGHGRRVSRIDPVGGKVVATWSPLDDDPAGVSAPPNAFWGTSSDARQAYAIDPSTNRLATEVAVPFSPCAAQRVGEMTSIAPCIESGQAPQVTVIGLSTASSVTMELPGWAMATLPIDGQPWLPLLERADFDGVAGVSNMIAIDPSAGDIVDVIRFDPPVYGLTLGFDALWLATADSVLRVPLSELRS